VDTSVTQMLGLLKKYLRITSTKMEKVTKRRINPDKAAHRLFTLFIILKTEDSLSSVIARSLQVFHASLFRRRRLLNNSK